MVWLNVVLPILVVAGVYISDRKYLWVSPIVSSAIFFVINCILVPGVFDQAEWTGFLLWAVVIHFVTAAVITAFAYLLTKNKRK